MRSVLLLLLLLNCAPSYAWGKPGDSTREAKDASKGSKAQKDAVVGEDEFKRQKLERFPDLPYLPEFPGKNVFLSGLVMPFTNHGPSYIVYFSVSENPKEVLSWYREALPGNRWKLTRQMKHMIDSRHPDGHSCIVMAQSLPPEFDSTTKTYKRPKTKVAIYFHVNQKGA